VVRDRCFGESLSPDGRLLACAEHIDGASPGYFNTQLTLFDVTSGEAWFKKARAYPVPDRNFLEWVQAMRKGEDFFRPAFSPDGHYFIMGYAGGETVIDLTARAEAKLPGDIRHAFRQPFAFVGADRVATIDPLRPDHSALLRFPSGERVKTLTLGGEITAATHGEYLLLRPIQSWPVGIVDIDQNKVVGASKTSPLDIYDGVRASEQPNGEIALYGPDSQSPLAVATLPRASLGNIAGASLSADLRWLALSVANRGGVWNLETGQRNLLVRGFSTSSVAPDGTLFADFANETRVRDGRVVQLPRVLARVEPTSGQTQEISARGHGGRRPRRFPHCHHAPRPRKLRATHNFDRRGRDDPNEGVDPRVP
jgi:hypothetical protein